MGCHLSRSASLEGSDTEPKPTDNANCAQTKNNDSSQTQKKQGRNKKKATTGETSANSTAAVGNKLANNQDGAGSSPELLNGLRRNDNTESSTAANNVPETPPLPPDKLHKNFQERLITSGITSSKPNGQRTVCDSQVDFFRMLDEKIAQGRDDDL